MNKNHKHNREEANEIFRKPTTYRSYVGPQDHYDFLGGTQFSLLWSLGLRSNHKLLDLGCGSLRGGKLFIPYLDKGNYYGIEPNKWLIDDAIKNELGNDLMELKKPTFDHNSEFSCEQFNVEFDFVLAQSIFSHCGPDLIKKALNNISSCMSESGIIAATFVKVSNKSNEVYESGWVYPKCFQYSEKTITTILNETDLEYTKIPWFHPRQTWYVLAKTKENLPSNKLVKHLHGLVINDEFVASQKNLD